MAVDNNPGQDGKSAEDIKRLQATMMAELGIHRVEELPMGDKHEDDDRRHRRERATDSFYDRRPRQADDRRHNYSHDVIVRSGDLGSVWKTAIESGIFDDDDAAGVKGLKDLGGARLYDTNRNSTQPGPSRLTHQPSSSFEVQAAPYRQSTTGSSRQGQRAPQGGPLTTVSLTKRLIAAMRQDSQQESSRRTRATSSNVAKAIGNNSPITLGNNADKEKRRPGRGVAAPAASPAEAPDASALAANAMVADPENMLVRVDVQFRPPSMSNRMPSTVFLTSGEPPAFGFFTVIVYGTKFCQWAISTYDDCLNGDHLELICLFHDGLGYSLVFKSWDELSLFYTSLKDLRAKKIEFMQKPISAANTAQANKSAPPKEPIESPAPAQSSRLIKKSEPATTADAASSATRAGSLPAPGLLSQNVEARPSQELASPIALGPEKPTEKLISLEADEVCVSPSVAPSEASELLSTLEPYDFSKKAAPTGPTPSFVEHVRQMAKVFLGVFFARGAAGKTKSEIAETIRGIREGIIEQFANDETLSVEDRQSIEPALFTIFEDVLNKAPEANTRAPANLPAPTAASHTISTGSNRIQYSAETMVDLRPNAVAPAVDLNNLSFMPKRDGPKRMQSVRSKPAPAWESSRLAAPASAMDWVMGNETIIADQKVTEEPTAATEVIDKQLVEQQVTQEQPVEQQVTQEQPVEQQATQEQSVMETTVKLPTTQAPKPDVGLQKSRWALPGLVMEQANAFTGLQYEKRWKKGSYLYDLALLDPNVEVNVGAEAIMDLFYPPQDRDSTFSESRLGNQPVAADVVSVCSSDLESLRRGLERMTLDSQRGASTGSSRHVSEEHALSPRILQLELKSVDEVSLPHGQCFDSKPENQPPSTLRGLGASRHARGAAPATSGKFDFVVPKQK